MSTTPLSLSVLHAASSRFEAARQVDMLPAGHRCRNLHGHGFTATAYARVPADWVTYPGGEVAALQRQIDRCAGLLNYGLLNDKVAQPTDENLARWIRGRLDAPGIDRVADLDELDLDLSDFAEVANQVTKLLKRQTIEFWNAKWKGSGYDTALGHTKVLEALVRISRNIKDGREWETDVDIV